MTKDDKNETHMHLEQVIRIWVGAQTRENGPLENVPAPIIAAVLDEAFECFAYLHSDMAEIDVTADEMIEAEWNFCDRCNVPWPVDLLDHDTFACPECTTTAVGAKSEHGPS